MCKSPGGGHDSPLSPLPTFMDNSLFFVARVASTLCIFIETITNNLNNSNNQADGMHFGQGDINIHNYYSSRKYARA